MLSYSPSGMRSSFFVFSALSLFLPLLHGCGNDRGGGVPATGTVTFNGELLIDGSVTYVDAQGIPAATGFIKNGRYEMNQSVSFKGVPPGSYRVANDSWIEPPGEQLEGGGISSGFLRTPKNFASFETSELAVEVGPRGGTYDFSLQGQSPPVPSRLSDRK